MKRQISIYFFNTINGGIVCMCTVTKLFSSVFVFYITPVVFFPNVSDTVYFQFVLFVNIYWKYDLLGMCALFIAYAYHLGDFGRFLFSLFYLNYWLLVFYIVLLPISSWIIKKPRILNFWYSYISSEIIKKKLLLNDLKPSMYDCIYPLFASHLA